MMEKLKFIVDWLLNKNPLLKKLDGYKTQIAGIVIGVALIVDAVISFLPPDLAIPAKTVSEGLKQLAAALGFVGGIGKLAKK